MGTKKSAIFKRLVCFVDKKNQLMSSVSKSRLALKRFITNKNVFLSKNIAYRLSHDLSTLSCKDKSELDKLKLLERQKWQKWQIRTNRKVKEKEGWKWKRPCRIVNPMSGTKLTGSKLIYSSCCRPGTSIFWRFPFNKKGEIKNWLVEKWLFSVEF